MNNSKRIFSFPLKKLILKTMIWSSTLRYIASSSYLDNSLTFIPYFLHTHSRSRFTWALIILQPQTKTGINLLNMSPKLLKKLSQFTHTMFSWGIVDCLSTIRPPTLFHKFSENSPSNSNNQIFYLMCCLTYISRLADKLQLELSQS